MKYSTSNPPYQCFMRQSRWYKNAPAAVPMGICWHSTGVDQTALSRYVQPDDNVPDRDAVITYLGRNKYGNDWNHQPDLRKGVHAFIGKLADGSVSTVNVGPWAKEGWGVGKGKKTGLSINPNWIQFECLEDSLKDPDYFNAVYREGVELTAYLCKLYNLDPMGSVQYHGITVPVILCHKDSYKLGLGSDHADVYNWFDRYGKTMEDVRRDVAALLAEPEPEQVQPAADGPSPWFAAACQWAQQNGILNGDQNGSQMWKEPVTREMMAQILKNYNDYLLQAISEAAQNA